MPDLGIGEALAGLIGPALEGGAEAGAEGGLSSLFGLGGEAAAGAGEALGAGLGTGVEGAGEALGAGLGAGTEGVLGLGAATGAAEGITPGVDALFGLGDINIPAGAIETATEPLSSGTMANLTGPITSGGVTSIGAGTTPTIDISALGANPAVTTVGGPAAAAAGGVPAGATGFDPTSLFKGLSWKDLIGPAVAAGGLGYQVLKGQQDLPSTTALKDQLGQITQDKAGLTDMGKNIINKGQDEGAALRGTGEQYTKYLAEGTLPPTMQAQLDQETKDAKAAIVSRYASMGLPTDPLKNSSLQQELAGIDERARIKSAALGQQLLQGGTSLIGAGTGIGSSTGATGTSLVSSGANLSGLQTNLLQMLSGIDQKQTENIGKAISNFAAALAGNKGGVTLKVA